MYPKALLRGVALAAAAAAVLATAGVVLAASPHKAPSHRRLEAVGRMTFKPNRYVKDAMRFSRDVTVIASGGTVTIHNRTDQPHTLSLVKRSQLPRTAAQVDACDHKVCGDIGKAHGATENGPPTKTLVDVGAPGFDQPGDSIFFGPKKTVKIKITAAKGKTLYFLCALHPWMQGSFKVR